MSSTNTVIVGTKPMGSYQLAIFRISKTESKLRIVARGNNIPKAIKLVFSAIENLQDKWSITDAIVGVIDMPFKPDPNKPKLANPPKDVKVADISIELTKTGNTGAVGARGDTPQPKQSKQTPKS